MISEDIIKKAASRGIVPGARIKCAYRPEIKATVLPYEKWGIGYNDSINVAQVKECLICAKVGHTWAEVIEAPPTHESLRLIEAPKPQTLEPGHSCKCGPAMRAAIMERAKELGLWHIDGKEENYSPARGMWLMSDSSLTYDGLPKVFYWDGVPTNKTLHIHEFLRLMENTKPPVKELTTEEKLAVATNTVRQLLKCGEFPSIYGQTAQTAAIAFLKSIKE